MSKNIRIKVSFPEKKYAELTKLAKNKNISFAELVRENCGVGGIVVKEKKRVWKVDPNLLAYLSRMGSNLNQIAKHTNKNKIIDNLVLDGISNIEEELKIIKSIGYDFEKLRD